ncbi:MAG: ABC transporter substrate-binding protein [Candidatus Rokubacteria bacterium]|nr:ABC transporter substrate-binding protein [Candidatus Rokubacteria bacterium]
MPLLIVLLQTLVVAVSGPATSPEYLPLRVAAAESHFAREGLAVQLKTTRAESGAAEALAQGQADLAATTLEAILRFGPRMPGQGARLVFGLTAAPPVALVVAASHAANVRSVEDLPGLRVGVATPGAPEHAWFGWLLARAGLSVAQLSVVSLGSRGLVAAIDAGDVHVGFAHEPVATRLLQEGRAALLADFRTPAAVAATLGAPTVNAAVFMRADRKVTDAQLVRFARALLAARQRLRTAGGASLAADLPVRAVGPMDEFEARLAATRGIYLPDGLVSPEQVQETITIVRSHTPLPASLRIPRPDKLLHTEPLRQALKARPPR